MKYGIGFLSKFKQPRLILIRSLYKIHGYMKPLEYNSGAQWNERCIRFSHVVENLQSFVLLELITLNFGITQILKQQGVQCCTHV